MTRTKVGWRCKGVDLINQLPWGGWKLGGENDEGKESGGDG